MKLTAYEVPPGDHDLLDCGVVLTPERIGDTRLYNAMRRAPDGSDYIASRRAEKATKGDTYRARGRLTWYETQLRAVAGCPDLCGNLPSAVERARAKGHLRRARERWGEEEWTRVVREAAK